MNYFDKIEAYITGTLGEMECLFFEAELTQNSALQEELAAAQLAQDLFGFLGAELSETEVETSDSVSLADALIGFTAANLSEEQILANDTITTAESAELADLLIGFTATNLSEEQILANDTITTIDSTNLADELIGFTAANLSEEQILATQPIVIEQPPIIRTLQPRRTKRTAWLAAASMLFVLSMIGSQFYTAQNSNQASVLVAEMPALIENTPLKAILINPSLEAVLAVNIPKKVIKKSYPPARVRVIKKTTPELATNQIAAADKVEEMELNTSKIVIENPIAMNTIAKEISTSAIIQDGETASYQATTSITLTSGFSAPPGTSFTAVTTQKETAQEVNSNSTISEKESVLLKANTSITLKPGFHAKVGADFKAEIGK